MKKVYLYIIFAVVVAVAVVMLDKPDMPVDTADGIVSPSPSLSVSATPARSTLPRASLKPTPGILVEDIVTYDQWVAFLEPLNRRLALDKDCTSSVPSQVEYLNNTKIMIDNSASAKARILKIAGREYSIDARAWILTTLSSTKLPAQLPVYCGDIEIGRLDLVAK